MSFVSSYYQDQEVDSERVKILEELFREAGRIEPRSVEGLSYGLPARKLNGRPLIGFSIAKNHMSIYPFSPKIIQALGHELSSFETSKGAIRFTEENIPRTNLLELIIELRKEQLN